MAEGSASEICPSSPIFSMPCPITLLMPLMLTIGGVAAGAGIWRPGVELGERLVGGWMLMASPGLCWTAAVVPSTR